MSASRRHRELQLRTQSPLVRANSWTRRATPGRRLPSHDELMTAIGDFGITLAEGGELTRNVYPSTRRARRTLTCSTSRMPSAALRSPQTQPPAPRPSAVSPTRSTSHEPMTTRTTTKRRVRWQSGTSTSRSPATTIGLASIPTARSAGRIASLACSLRSRSGLVVFASSLPPACLRFRLGATTASVASEPDDQQEGVVVPGPGASSPPVGDGPGQGSGGETALPLEVDPVLTDPEADPTAGQPEDAAPTRSRSC